MDKSKVAADVPHAVKQFCSKHRLLKQGDHLLVGVSGGADSVALLLCLRDMAQDFAVRLTVAHLNHGLRGQVAADDALFVAALCRAMAVPLVSHTVDVAARHKSSGESLQQAARRERFRFFADVCRGQGQNKVALAHHQDDQVETMLLNLMRGTGLKGLAGMRPLDRGLFDLTLIRPLLAVNRASIEAFLAERGQKYRDDHTNLDTKYRRNLVRHEVLPLLGKLNSDAARALLRVNRHMQAADDYISAQATSLWLTAHAPLSYGTGLRLDSLRHCHRALTARLLQWAHAQECMGESDMETAHIEACLGLLDRQAGRKIRLPGGITAQRARHHLVFYRAQPDLSKPYEIELSVPGEAVLPDGSVISAEPVAAIPAHYPPSSAAIAYITGTNTKLTVRNRRPGDTYIPLGASGHKKLKQAMSEAEIPLPWRDTLPVVVFDDMVVWVPGLRIAEQFRVPEDRLANAFKLTYSMNLRN